MAGLVFSFVAVLLINGSNSSPVVQQAANIGGPFRLTDQNGKSWTLPSIMGPKGAMLVFFRSADW